MKQLTVRKCEKLLKCALYVAINAPYDTFAIGNDTKCQKCRYVAQCKDISNTHIAITNLADIFFRE